MEERKDGRRDGRKDGRKQGRKKGREDGRTEGPGGESPVARRPRRFKKLRVNARLIKSDFIDSGCDDRLGGH